MMRERERGRTDGRLKLCVYIYIIQLTAAGSNLVVTRPSSTQIRFS